MKRTLALILALVMVMALVACGGDKPTSSTPTTPSNPTTSNPSTSTPGTDKPAEDPDAWKYGGTFIAASSNATSTQDPHDGAGSLGNSRWMDSIYEGLLVRSVEGVYYPQVCTYEASPDGKVIKITLRERYFSNGDKITIEDVWASINRYAGNTATSTWDKYFKDCDIKREGDSITFTHKNYNINFMQIMASTSCCVMPKEICDKYPVTGGEVMPNGLLRGGKIEVKINEDADVIGSGPYKLVSWSDTEVDMVRNDKYVADEFEGATGKAAPKRAYFDEIIIAVNTSEDSRTAAAIAGEYHLSWIGNPAMMPAAEAAGMVKYDQGTTWTHGMFFNLDPSNADSPIANVNVRKAIRAALDCNAIMMGPTGGEPSAIALVPTPVQADTVYHNTIVADNEWNIHDEALAKEYLKKANYNGEPIVYLITAAASNNMHKAAMIAVSQMEKIGLNIELMLVDNGSHSALRKDPKTGHDIGCWNVQKRDDNPVLHSTFVTGSQGWWDSDAKNAALAKMKSTITGTPESIAAYEEYCQAVVDEVPYILYGHALNFNFVSDKVVYDVQGNSEYYWNSYFKK